MHPDRAGRLDTHTSSMISWWVSDSRTYRTQGPVIVGQGGSEGAKKHFQFRSNPPLKRNVTVSAGRDRHTGQSVSALENPYKRLVGRDFPLSLLHPPSPPSIDHERTVLPSLFR